MDTNKVLLNQSQSLQQSIVVNPKSSQTPIKKLPGKNQHYIMFQDKPLGKGAFATVYQGRSMTAEPKKNYAIKVISKETLRTIRNASYEQLTKYLNTEIKILANFNHPNIIHLEEFIQTPSNFYIIFELCEGGDLYNFLKENGRLDEFTAQRFFYQLAQAIR